jgi:Family of unknown function (DUF6152)
VKVTVHTPRNGGIGRSLARSTWPLVLGGVVILCVPLLGHHSFAAYYVEQDTIEVEGEIVEFEYKNPHSWIHVLGDDAFGRPKTYSAEWASTSRLESDGITRKTLSAGDKVRIWASPSRDPKDNRIRLRRIERRSDGWHWGQNRRENR